MHKFDVTVIGIGGPPGTRSPSPKDPSLTEAAHIHRPYHSNSNLCVVGRAVASRLESASYGGLVKGAGLGLTFGVLAHFGS